MVTQMWLPLETCKEFEKAFNLTWNATAKLYLLSETQHAALLAQNPTFTFKIGSSASGGENVDIVLPYAAFDLSASHPLVESETRYFPLKRAYNSSQYTLGRVFLQEAYVIADYDRRNFSVSQAVFPDREVGVQIVSVEPPGDLVGQHGTDHPSTATIIGISVGAFIALVITVVLFICCRKSDRSSVQILSSKQRVSIDSAHGQGFEMSANEQQIHEPDSRRAFPPEMDAGAVRWKRSSRLYELGSPERAAVELEGSGLR